MSKTCERFRGIITNLLKIFIRLFSKKNIVDYKRFKFWLLLVCTINGVVLGRKFLFFLFFFATDDSYLCSK